VEAPAQRVQGDADAVGRGAIDGEATGAVLLDAEGGAGGDAMATPRADVERGDDGHLAEVPGGRLQRRQAVGGDPVVVGEQQAHRVSSVVGGQASLSYHES